MIRTIRNYCTSSLSIYSKSWSFDWMRIKYFLIHFLSRFNHFQPPCTPISTGEIANSKCADNWKTNLGILKVFGVANVESAVRLDKFNMADRIWRSQKWHLKKCVYTTPEPLFDIAKFCRRIHNRRYREPPNHDD